MKRIKFPEYLGIKCNMMPFIQGDIYSVPAIYASYFDILKDNYLEKGRIGFLTIDESFVNVGESQRGYNSGNTSRNVHIEVGIAPGCFSWGGNGPTLADVKWGNTSTWGKSPKVTLAESTRILIANNIDNTCRVWENKVERRITPDGDLSTYLKDYPEYTGRLLKAGEVVNISIFTPHECITQTESSNRQFFRIVGEGVNGREDYFTENPLLKLN